ncbi:MAG: class I SAM-dependent methyltransferase [Candidatus Malihini olakiniferum]
MQYSFGYWKEASSLEEAQQANCVWSVKNFNFSRALHCWISVVAGADWPPMLPAIYGVSVYDVTISFTRTAKLAEEHCRNLNVTIQLQDYLDLNRNFYRIVSVGMFEHVRPKNYDTYFRVVSQNLKSEGLFLLHTIEENKTDSQVDPWINKYIFPNGCLPSARHIATRSEPYLVMEDWYKFALALITIKH